MHSKMSASWERASFPRDLVYSALYIAIKNIKKWNVYFDYMILYTW